MDEKSQGVGEVLCTVFFGNEREIHVEFREDGIPWMSAGAGIDATDVWMKGQVQMIDLRVCIRRDGNRLLIAVDRGQQSAAWWPIDGLPRLTITVDPVNHTAAASAGVGVEQQFQEVLLGQTAI